MLSLDFWPGHTSQMRLGSSFNKILSLELSRCPLTWWWLPDSPSSKRTVHVPACTHGKVPVGINRFNSLYFRTLWLFPSYSSPTSLSLCSVGTGKSHAVVISVQYLYWPSLVACAKGFITASRILHSSAQWCVCIDLCPCCLFFSQFSFSIQRQFSHVKLVLLNAKAYGGAVALSLLVRNKLLCWPINKAQ